jgi:hypothetical protein
MGFIGWQSYYNKTEETKKAKLRGANPRANHTDRATAARRWSQWQPLRIEGATRPARRIPTAVLPVLQTGAATPNRTHETEWTPLQTHNLPEKSGRRSVARNSDQT